MAAVHPMEREAGEGDMGRRRDVSDLGGTYRGEQVGAREDAGGRSFNNSRISSIFDLWKHTESSNHFVFL